MSALARPGLVALVLVLTALVLHPELRSDVWLKERSSLLAGLLVLAALALVSRAAQAAPGGRLGEVLVAAGMATLLAALGADGVWGHHGTLTLAAGQASSNFEEIGPGRRRLGLRPLGFVLQAQRVEPDGRTRLAVSGSADPVDLEVGRAVALGAFRLARLRLATSGGVARLRVAVADGVRTEVADVAPGRVGHASDLTIALEEYFPDFALDESQRPFSRSAEHRNPAALLSVTRGGRVFRAFVIRAMPGVHRVEGLGRAFSLLEVEEERSVEMDVHRDPAALAALVGGLLLVAGLSASVVARAPAESPLSSLEGSTPVLVSGAALLAFLLVADRGAVLTWIFSVPSAAGRVPLPGAGVLFGVTLIAVLGGVLLLVAQRLAGPGSDVRKAALALLWTAVGFGALGASWAAIQLVRLSPRTLPRAGLPVAGQLAAVALLVASLWSARALDSARPRRRLSAVGLPLVVALTALGGLAAGVFGVLRDGTYATATVCAFAAAALLGRSALEATSLAAARRLAFLVALLALTVG